MKTHYSAKNSRRTACGRYVPKSTLLTTDNVNSVSCGGCTAVGYGPRQSEKVAS